MLHFVIGWQHSNQEKKYQSVVLLFCQIFALEKIILCVHHYSLVYCEAKRVARIFFFFGGGSPPPPSLSLSLPLPFFLAFFWEGGWGDRPHRPPWLRACVKHLRVIFRTQLQNISITNEPEIKTPHYNYMEYIELISCHSVFDLHCIHVRVPCMYVCITMYMYEYSLHLSKIHSSPFICMYMYYSIANIYNILYI